MEEEHADSQLDGGSDTSHGIDEGSPLSESIAKELDALEHVIADDMAEQAKLRKFLQRLRLAWLASDGSAERMLKNPCIARLRSGYPSSSTLIDRVSADIGRQRSGHQATLERAVRSYCESAHQPCQGRFPHLTVAHFVEVSIDAKTGRAKVGTVSVQSIDWQKIRPTLEREITRVWHRPFNAPTFRDKLLAVYNRVDARSHSPTGFVRLDDIFKELRGERSREDPRAKAGGRLSSYYRDEFCADLSKLWKAQVSGELPGTQLEFAAIRRAEEGFSVVLPSGDIATYGFVKPRR